MTDVFDRLKAALAERYRIERELGEGGMATVYLAHDLKHNRKVALKVLRPELAEALGAERFLREIETTANLRHPHILPLYDSGDGAGFLYYVMPFVEGESLRDRMNREKQLPLDDALPIAREVADALDYAHSRGVIHRDVKPENILLESGHAVVADFGIARAVDAAGGDRLTETGLSVGTPTYMSPEQAAGERELDGRSDLYALGCVLYEMLAGQPPFTGPTVESVIHQHLTAASPPVTQFRPAVPPEITGALQRSLAKAPADRFNSVAQFAAALGAAPGHGSQVVAPSGRTTPRRWAILAAAVAALVLGAVGWWITHRQAPVPLADDLIAVAPFDVLDPGLSLWSEGMVDVLARNLDGAGALRTVAPTVVIRQWSGRADPTSATALGRATGAGLAVFGQLLSTHGDSVRATATLLDVAGGRTLGEIEVRDRNTSMDRVADSLTIGVLRQLGRSRPVGAVRATALQSTSLPALKAFLQGEQLFRRTAFDSALAAYRQAVDADSTLAVAWWRMATAISWASLPTDTIAEVYSLRAAALNRGLSPRDSLMISADSLATALYTASRDTMFRAHRARLFATLQAVVQRYPNDPEAWYLLGDASHHFPVPGQTSVERTLALFDRAIVSDSAFGESYIHAVWLALQTEQPELAHRYITAYLARNRRAGDAHVRAYAVLDRLLTGQLATPDGVADAIEDLANQGDLRELFLATAHWPDTGEVAVRVARAGTAVSSSGNFWPTLLVASFAYRGHLQEAYAVADGAAELVAPLAPLGGVPPAVASQIFRAWLDDPPFAEAPSPQPHGFNTTLFTALPWWASQRDTASLARFADVLEAAEPRAVADVKPWLRYGRDAATAYLSLARADTTRAVEQFRALPDTICSCPYDRIVAADLLMARGLASEALHKFAGQDPSFLFPGEGLWRLTRGRAFEAVGERDSALGDYAYVVALWQRADQELQPYVSEAKDALARLTAEPRQ
jgi:tRNA A-37 threonylcarbamoyl transferase component Bud32/tetratricopeptide (TPR) repeat protein